MAAAPAPDDFHPAPAFAQPDDPMAVLHAAQGLDAPGPASADLARKLEAWFAASHPGPVPARPEDVVRFVARGAEEPPLHRWRILEGGVLERWTVVETPIKSSNIATIAFLANQDRVIGWNVVRLPTPRANRIARLVIDGRTVVALDAFGRRIPADSLSHLEGEALREHVLSLQLAPEDDATYNGFYPTLPGNDVMHYRDAKEFGRWRSDMAEHQGGELYRKQNPDPSDPTEDGYLRGGREIRGGRAEHRLATKGMTHVDDGYWRDVRRAEAEKKAAQKAANREKIARTFERGPERVNEV